MRSPQESTPILLPALVRIIPACSLAAVMGLLLAALPAQAAEWGIAQLMQSLKQRGAERALFVEKKFIAILDKPLESSGELNYVPPDRLEKRTLKPRPESVLVDGDRLTIERGNQQRSLRLHDYPDIAAFIDSIRGTLAGDRKALEQVYRLELHGDQERWTLVMFPSDAKLATLVLRIDVTGTRDRVRSIEILQADGDRSVLTVERIAGAAGAARPLPR
jgi:Outer membrane lipoprotein carrier protein LolA-like